MKYRNGEFVVLLDSVRWARDGVTTFLVMSVDTSQVLITDGQGERWTEPDRLTLVKRVQPTRLRLLK